MRIGEMELDEILHNCAKLNMLIKGSVQEADMAWGLAIQWYEITEVSPNEQIHTAMDKQAAAECMRCEQVLQAEGNKQWAQLTSEGVKILLTNESEGNLIRYGMKPRQPNLNSCLKQKVRLKDSSSITMLQMITFT